MDSTTSEKPTGDPDFVQHPHEGTTASMTDESGKLSLEKEANGGAHHGAQNGALDEKKDTEVLAEAEKSAGPPKHDEEKRSRGRIAIIMFALGVRTLLPVICRYLSIKS